MFTCLWQLWDWLDPPLLFTTMESKKAHNLQQGNNTHLPTQMMSQSSSAAFHPTTGDYRPPNSPVFQNYPQYQGLTSNFAQINLTPQQTATLSKQQQQAVLVQTKQPGVETSSQIYVKPLDQRGGIGGSSSHIRNMMQYEQSQHLLPQNYDRDHEQLYQSTAVRQRVMQQQPYSSQSHLNNLRTHNHSSSQLQQHYQQLQQAKMQQQIKTQNDALIQQQRTFALRQQINPPVPHFHMQSQSSLASIPQLSQKNIPPQSLNLQNQYQPSNLVSSTDRNDIYGTSTASRLHQNVHLNNQHLQKQRAQNQGEFQQNQQIQQQLLQHREQLQRQKDNQNQIIIHQNHPHSVVNQACQTQLSGTTSKTPNSGDSSSSPATPTHQPLEKRKSGGQTQALKSPITKRPANGAVTLAGWLYKQGSEGLKVWRKRWFVLSEYCLYYYKGPEEEKLLGSILLPSYQVSSCSNDDKVYRKFAFKCEHINMRTYWLAAENGESMAQWIRALTAASMMQRSSESEQTPQPSVSSLNQSGDNSDSGIQTYQSQQSKLSVAGPLTPASDSGAGSSGGMQPLYANAPPKPKRANDGGYSSPSPENMNERYDSNYDTPRQYDTATMQQHLKMRDLKSPSHHNHEKVYESRIQGQHETSKLAGMTGNAPDITAYQSTDTTTGRQQQQYQMGLDDEIYNTNRTNTIESNQKYGGGGTNIGNDQLYGSSHTEQDIIRMQQYLQQQKYLNQMANAERRTPDIYGRSRSMQFQQQQQLQQQYPGKHVTDYEDIFNLNNRQNQLEPNGNIGTYKRPVSPTGYDNRGRQMQMRYPTNYTDSNLPVHVQMRARPVQPQHIPRPHSADFLEYEARAAEERKPHFLSEAARAPRPKSSLDINRSSDSFYYSEASYAEKMRQSALYLQTQPQLTPDKMSGISDYMYRPQKGDGMTPTSYSASNTMQRDLDYERQYGKNQETASSMPRTHRPMNRTAHYTNDQFARSASARLPRNKDEQISERDGEKKREESMKRLLEWKQRMLQSPLTRKGVPVNMTSSAKLQIPQKGMTQGLQRSRSETNANAGYNSYSSDDEASISVRNVRNINKPTSSVKSDHYGSNVNLYQSNNSLNPFLQPNQIDQQQSYDPYDYDERLKQRRSPYLYTDNKMSSESGVGFRKPDNSSKSLDVSAGDLLSRTHEELVLLLIQLRRQNSTTARAIEQCCTDIHDLQNAIRNTDGKSRMENMNKLESVKQHLFELEKQYEKSKPLVNLVDNMVKLGSLYRGGNGMSNPQIHSEASTLDKLQFNQKIQERRLLQEERKHWDRLSPNHLELKSKVQQLFQLDQLLQEESGTLQSLQRDKEDIERALGGLRAQLQNGDETPIALEAARRQQHTLERELSRIYQLLAENSKKLEQTIAGNARLEQELLVLRQKLQASRSRSSTCDSQGGYGSSKQNAAPDSISYTGSATAVLELELRRVQQLVSDMQKQRQELSHAVRQLTENSNTLCRQIKSEDNSPTNKKKSHFTGWSETDLDSMSTVKHSTSNNSLSTINTNGTSSKHHNSVPITPLYVDTDSANSNISIVNATANYMVGQNNYHHNYENHHIKQESEDLDTESEEQNYSSQDKQEPKTLRMVKRESQQRQRDREKQDRNTSYSTQALDQALEDENKLFAMNNYNNTKSLPKNYIDHEVYRPENNNFTTSPAMPMKYSDYYDSLVNQYPISMTDRNSTTYKATPLNNINNVMATSYQEKKVYPENNSGLKNKTESIQSLNKVGNFSPVFQSEAAKQIIGEMSNTPADQQQQQQQQHLQQNGTNNKDNVSTANKHRRAVPKEKRRHFTAPHHSIAASMQSMQSENDLNKNGSAWRARDDLDMEVALRPRINTPDVVRSAVGPREKISETTIDKLFGAPNKILIPERYVPEQTPELSPEEKKKRQEKVEAIKKMLSEAPINTSNDAPSLPPSQINAEKKQREHLLQLNQLLAQQVMQMSKIVAEKAMAALPSKVAEINAMSEEDHSPTNELPIYQQRDNFFT